MYTKFAKFAQGYIFYSLQHFTTKLRNFSKRGMLFEAMVIFLPISIFFKILSERGKVHYQSIYTADSVKNFDEKRLSSVFARYTQSQMILNFT